MSNDVARKRNGHEGPTIEADASAAVAEALTVDHELARASAARRPYVRETDSFSARMQVDLNYADTELAIVRANIRALQEREADLMNMRDAALASLGTIQHGREEAQQT